MLNYADVSQLISDGNYTEALAAIEDERSNLTDREMAELHTLLLSAQDIAAMAEFRGSDANDIRRQVEEALGHTATEAAVTAALASLPRWHYDPAARGLVLRYTDEQWQDAVQASIDADPPTTTYIGSIELDTEPPRRGGIRYDGPTHKLTVGPDTMDYRPTSLADAVEHVRASYARGPWGLRWAADESEEVGS